MLWLDEKRGYLSDYVTQLWVKASGRRVDLVSHPWLAGPVGPPIGIGADFFQQFASIHGLQLQRGDGLIPDFAILAGAQCVPAQVSETVRDFYQHTSRFELEAWSEWAGMFRPFGRLLALIFSGRLQQLNVPLSPLDTSHGITSEVVDLVVPVTGEIKFTAWIRQLLRNQNVLYAGAYSVCSLPEFPGRCVKVVFPLPNGNAIVIMSPKSNPDGSLVLTSAGQRFGDPGFYFTVLHADRLWAKYVPALRECIRVYGSGNDVRADHVLRFFGIEFLRLHYRLRSLGKDASSRAAAAEVSGARD
jgi:hypothetical protein